MAVSEHKLEIVRGSQRQDTLRKRVDIDREDELETILACWLERNRIDPGFWEDYLLTVPGAFRLIEVRVA